MENLWLVLISLLAIILGCVWHRCRRNRPPGPWNVPVIGHLAFLDQKFPYVTLSNLSRKYGPIYGLYLGSIYTVVLSDAKLIRKIFNKDSASGRAPLHLTHGIMKGYGLICAEGDLWRDQRKFVSNTLRSMGASKIGPNRSKMQQFIMQHVLDLVHHLQSHGNTVTLDPLDPLRHSLGSAVNQIVFGKFWERDDPIWKWLLHLQEEGTKHIGVAGPLNFLPFLRFLPKSKQTMRFLIDGKLQTHKIYNDIIKQTVAGDSNNFISAFLEEKNKRDQDDKFYNDEQFHHLLADVFGASLDTTLTTLRWFLLYLAVHEDAQKKLREQMEVLGDSSLTMDDTDVVPYLEATIAETQRIRSVVPVGIPHGILQDMEIENYFIPKGTMIVPLQWAIHMDPKLWDEPEQFRPERFINEEGKFFKPESFLPFQTGKRMCVGEELGRMFLYLFGGNLIKNFHVSVQDNNQIDLSGDCGITLTPKPHSLIFRNV